MMFGLMVNNGLEKLFGQNNTIGHSLGGWIATNIASKRPDLVKKLVLVDHILLHLMM